MYDMCAIVLWVLLQTVLLTCHLGPETVDLLDKLIINPQEQIMASQALYHNYFWADPLPADPKT